MSAGKQCDRATSPGPKGILAPALVILVALAVAEGVTARPAPHAGLALHAALLVALLGGGATCRDGPVRHLLLAASLAPLIRVIGLSLPLMDQPPIARYGATGALLLVAADLAARELGLSAEDLGITLRGLPCQLGIGLVGLPLGLVTFVVLRPDPLVETLAWHSVLPAGLILMVSTGLAEELVFRGVIQRAAVGALGRFGVVYGAAVYAALQISTGSLAAVGLAWAVGLLFGWLVWRTKSLFGVTLAHGFATFVALVAGQWLV